MDKDILICLQALEWIRLEPHLPSDVCERLAEDDRGMPMLEGRIVPDDATYQRLLEIARIHCPEIVKHIEKERQKCVVEGGRADDPQEIEQKMDEVSAGIPRHPDPEIPEEICRLARQLNMDH